MTPEETLRELQASLDSFISAPLDPAGLTKLRELVEGVLAKGASEQGLPTTRTRLPYFDPETGSHCGWVNLDKLEFDHDTQTLTMPVEPLLDIK